jgi:hypothetical protein
MLYALKTAHAHKIINQCSRMLKYNIIIIQLFIYLCADRSSQGPVTVSTNQNGNRNNNSNNNNNNNNKIKFLFICVPTQQPKGQLQSEHE